MSKKTAYAFLSIVATVFVLFLFFISLVAYEFITKKENPLLSIKVGNCRILNTDYALKNKFDIYTLEKYDKNNTRQLHVVAVDKNKRVHDVSNGNNIKGTISLADYMKKSNAHVLYYIDAKNDKVYNSQGTVKDMEYMKAYLFLARNFGESQKKH